MCSGEGKKGFYGPCDGCGGSGKVSSKTGNRKFNCKQCLRGNRLYPEKLVTCDSCNGVGRVGESLYDTAPEEIWQGLTFKVYRDATITYAESLIGHGCVFSCGDYGQASKATDEAVIADVKGHKHHQACKFARDDGTIANHVGIFVNSSGYKVQAVFDD